MRKSTIILLASLGLIIGTVQAQDQAIPNDGLPTEPYLTGANMSGASDYLHRTLFSFNYSLSFPMTDFKEYISNMGYRGWDVELRTFVLEKIAIGAQAGWYAFYEKRERETYEFDEGAITSSVFTYLYSVPLRAKVEFFIAPSSYIQPFIGLYVGTNYNDRITEVGFYSFEEKSWNFSLAPELGVIIPFRSNAPWGLNLKAKYNYQVYNQDDFQGLEWLDVTIGLTYSY